MIASQRVCVVIGFVLSVCHVRRLLLRRRWIDSWVSTVDLVLRELSVLEVLIH